MINHSNLPVELYLIDNALKSINQLMSPVQGIISDTLSYLQLCTNNGSLTYKFYMHLCCIKNLTYNTDNHCEVRRNTTLFPMPLS